MISRCIETPLSLKVKLRVEFFEFMKPEVDDSGSIALKGILDKFRV